MNPRPIEEAKNADLRGSFPALQRAALRARTLATLTGTALVISRNGVVEYRPAGRGHQLPATDSPQALVGEVYDAADIAERFLREDVEWGLKGDD